MANFYEEAECIVNYKPKTELQREIKKGQKVYITKESLSAEYDEYVQVKLILSEIWGLVPRYCIKKLT